LLVYDGRIKRLELDLFHHLVINWFGNLLWLQPKKQQIEYHGIINFNNKIKNPFCNFQSGFFVFKQPENTIFKFIQNNYLWHLKIRTK
jgi:hypothetical protein